MAIIQALEHVATCVYVAKYTCIILRDKTKDLEKNYLTDVCLLTSFDEDSTH